MRVFLCECGDTACMATVTLPIAAAAEPALAPGHGC